MSSQLESAVASIQMGDYVSLAAMIAIAYDYILMIPDEIEQIWCKPWTWVTVLFVLVRYVGLLAGFMVSIIGTSFVAGPMNLCFAIYILQNWSFSIFLCAADIVMMLRVYALYRRSKWLLVTLFLIYIPGAVLILLTCILYDIPKNDTDAIVQIANYSICVVVYPAYRWRIPLTMIQLVLAGFLSLLVIVQFARQALQMHRATKRWQFNRYLGLFLREGIAYFLALLAYNIYGPLVAYNVIPGNGWAAAVLFLLCTIPIVTLVPRFVISVRILYARDVEGRYPLFTDLDTGFGFSTHRDRLRRPVHGASSHVVIRTLSFTNWAQMQDEGESFME